MREATNRKEHAMMSLNEDDSELLNRFATRPKDQQAARALLERLRERMLVRIRQQWPELVSRYEELEARALLRLVRLRNKGELVGFETLDKLAWKLIDAEAVQEQRTDERDEKLRREALVGYPISREPDLERRVIARELLGKVLELIQKLPAQHALVLQALIAETTGEGPVMARALGITRQAARERLKAARAALLDAAVDANLDEPLKDFFESEG
jgi:hypothetical protein